LVVLIDGRPTALAYIECIKSWADRDGVLGLPEKRRDGACFFSLGGRMRYIFAMAIDAVEGTLFVIGRHAVTYSWAVFSSE